MFSEFKVPAYCEEDAARRPWYAMVSRILVPVVLAMALFLLVMHFLFIPILRDYLLSARRETIESQATTVSSLLETYQQRVEEGELGLEDAQQRAMNHIRRLRYGPEQKDYFWIQDTDAVMLMHPYRPDLVGSNMYAYEDPTGNPFMQEITSMAATQGYGFVDYVWQWMDNPTQQLAKVSYIRKFRPWNWVLGTGMYIQDLEHKVKAVRGQLFYVVGLLFIVLLLISAYIVLVAIRAERRRWASEQLRAVLVSMLESTSDMVSMSDTERNIIYMNRAGRRMLGWPEEGKLEGLKIVQCHPEETVRTLLETAIPEAARSGLWHGTLQLKGADGKIIPVSQVVMSHRNADGEILYLSTIARDISREKEYEEELRRKNGELRESVLRTERLARKAEQASKTKSLFLANMSHELRTPLNAIIGCVDLLMETELSGDQQELARTIHTSGEVLFFTISDILDLSKIESGKITCDESAFSLRKLADECLEVVRSVVENKGLELRAEVDEEIPESLHGDHIHLRQTLLNLLNNAVKFTETGSVRLCIGLTARSACGCHIRFEVHDTGIGLGDEERAIIFEPFRQTDHSLTRKYGGTGLGLAICREFVRMLGGELKVSSVKGQGSCFSFEIMLRQPVAAHDSAVPNRRGEVPDEQFLAYAKSLKMLVVEDNAFNRIVTCKMLRSLGLEPDEATEGQSALAQHARQHYDLIFMDVQMPTMDGLSATRKLREQGDDVYIIGLTAHAYQSDRNACLEAGMNGYLSKPVKKVHLVAALSKGVRDLQQKKNREKA
jgi:PAS domain S-box-containing protein